MFEKKDFDMAITTIYRVYTEARNRSGIVPSSVVPADQSYAFVPLAPLTTARFNSKDAADLTYYGSANDL